MIGGWGDVPLMVYSAVTGAAAAFAGWGATGLGVPVLAAAAMSLALVVVAMWAAEPVLRWFGFRVGG